MNLELKMARQKFGRIYPKHCHNEIKSAEESFASCLSILHNSYRNQDWVKKLKEKIRIDDGGIDLVQ